jgi:DnaJ-class molecular chaperone
MKNHYQTLGLHSSASADEIRRAYRILARRYHPDLNPGQLNAERFRNISEAHEVLSDAQKRASYDTQIESLQSEHLNRGFVAFERSQSRRSGAGSKRASQTAAQFTSKTSRSKSTASQTDAQPPPTKKIRKVTDHFRDLLRNAVGLTAKQPQQESRRPVSTAEVRGVAKVSVIEVSVSIHDAILGVKKAIEIPEPEGQRKLSVRIPAGVKNGSVIRLRAKNSPGEDIVLIVRVAAHPFLSIHSRGLVAEVPITIQEAIIGANISVPTLEEPVSIKIPAGSQSGSEIRLKNRGIISKDGGRGDLFIRLLIKVPDSPEAVGLKQLTSELEKYYSTAVRQDFPKSLAE